MINMSWTQLENGPVVIFVSNVLFQNFADSQNIPLIETSAKTSNNVEQLFAFLASDLKHASENGHIKDETPTITTNAGKDHKTVNFMTPRARV